MKTVKSHVTFATDEDQEEAGPTGRIDVDGSVYIHVGEGGSVLRGAPPLGRRGVTEVARPIHPLSLA